MISSEVSTHVIYLKGELSQRVEFLLISGNLHPQAPANVMHSSEPSTFPSDLLSQEFIHFPNFVPVFLMALTLSQISMGK